MGGGSDIKSPASQKKYDVEKQNQPIHDEYPVKDGATGVSCGPSRLVIGLLVALIVLSASISITYFLVRNAGECSDDDSWPDPWGDKEPVTFDDWKSGFLSPAGYGVTWIDGQNSYLRKEQGDLVVYSAPNFDTPEVLVSKSVFDEASGEYFFSPDMRYLLFVMNKEKKWRYSYDATYKIYDLQSRTWHHFPADKSFDGKPLQLARWTGGRDSSLAFVHDNTLYYQSHPESELVQVVEEGSVERHIFAGHTDWVYEEDILFTNKAFWGSADGKYLVYGLFDESHLPIQEMTKYGNEQYNKQVRIAYPKPALNETQGTSRIQVKVWYTGDGVSETINPPAELHSTSGYYVTGVSWKDESNIKIVWTERQQDKAVYTTCNALTTICNTNYVQEEQNGWILAGSSSWFTANNEFYNGQGHDMLPSISPKPEGTSGNWRHIALHTSEVPGGQHKQIFLTEGQKEVSEIKGVNKDKHIIYYFAYSNNGRDRHLYRVGTPDAELHLQRDTCITCDMECDYFKVSFSTTTDYYLLTCLGKDVPWYKLMAVNGENHSTVKMLEDNSAFKEKIEDKAMPKQGWLTIPIGDGLTAEAAVWLPPNYQDRKKHPLLVHVNAGPSSHNVRTRWEAGWMTYMSSMEGVVVAKIDGRGSEGNGDRHRFALDRRLGTVEIDDQISAVRWMIENMNIDKDKVAITNVIVRGGDSYNFNSYGGFAALHALADSQEEKDVFKCGIVQSPVTDFRLYNAVWTERQMGTARVSDNLAGYERTDILKKTNYLRGKKIFLAHGLADDNVNFQHSARLMEALNEADIQYKTLVRPNGNMYTMERDPAPRMYTDFLIEDCFGHESKDKQYKPRK